MSDSHWHETVGAYVGVPHNLFSWAHLLLIQLFLAIWGLTSILNGIPTLPYYVNVIIYPITMFFALCGIIAYSAWCKPKKHVEMGVSDASLLSVSRQGDKFYWVASFFISFFIGALAIFCFSLNADMARDPTVAIHNLTDADLTNSTLVDFYVLSTVTDAFTLTGAILHFIVFFSVIIIVGANQASVLTINALAEKLKIGAPAVAGTASAAVSALATAAAAAPVKVAAKKVAAPPKTNWSESATTRV